MVTAKPPIQVVHLFPVLDELLISLVSSLTAAQWQAPILARKWCVKDVAAHLLDTNMRAISLSHHYQGDPPGDISSYSELVAYLNRLNADWVQAMKRVSPQQLVNLLESTGKAYCRLLANTPLFDPAPFPVAWAGEASSVNWFHIARDYTEKWHHQMQIRDAVAEPHPLMERALFYPCISTFMYGLPHALRNVKPKDKTLVQVSVTGEAGGDWYVVYENEGWQLSANHIKESAAVVSLPPGIAWKLFTKGISPAEAAKLATLKGDDNICYAVLGMISVMA